MSNLQNKSAVQKRLNLAPIKAVIVNGPDGSPNVPGFSGLIWVALYTASGLSTPTAVRFTKIESSEVGTPVLLGFDESRTLSIINPDFDGQLATGINPISSNVLADPNVSGNNFLNQYQITTLWSGPISSASDSMLVTVQPWPYVRDGIFHRFLGGDGTGTASVDLTSYIPASAGMQCLAVLFVDDTDMIEVQASTPIPASDPFSDDDVQECITNASSGAKNKPVIAYRLYNGQTTIKPGFFDTDGDVYLDLRNFINVPSSGGSGTVTSVGLSTDASYLTVGSSPVTTSGTITLDKTTGLAANKVVATPNGSTGAADLRSLVAADLPNTAVTPASYTNTNLTVDAQGRITAASNGTDNGITQLTGDVTAGPGSGSQAATLATVNSNVGSFTNASLTVNGKGLITAASSGTAPVTSIGVTFPIESSGGTTPTIDINLIALAWKLAAQVVSQSNVSVSSAPSTIDSVTLSSGDRVLLTGQTTASENGLWVFNGASSAMTRPTDFGSGNTLAVGWTVLVRAGTIYTGALFYLFSTTGGTTIDTCSQTWQLQPFVTSGSIRYIGASFNGTLGPGSLTGTRVWTLPDASGTIILTTATQTLTNKTLVDASTFIVDDGDNTKILQFQVSGVSAGTTRTLTVPNASGTIALTSDIPSLPLSTTNGGTGQDLHASTGSLIVTSGTVSANTNTGTGNSVLASSPTIVTPTIASFANATHNHTNAAGGGQLTDAALSAAVGTAKGGTGQDFSASTGAILVSSGTMSAQATTGTGNVVRAGSPTITTPTIGDFTNSTHNHQNAAGGGTLDAAAIASGTLSESRLPHKFAVIEEQQAQNTAGGGSTATTWTKRVLNTEVVDADNIVRIAVTTANTFTPVSGTFRITAQSPFISAAAANTSVRIRLWNTTQGTEVIRSPNLFLGGATNGGNAMLTYQFTANGTDEYEIDYWVTQARATNGLGLAINETSAVERYTRVDLYQVG